MKIKFKKTYNPKPLKQLAREIVEIDDKQLNKKLVKKTNNPHYFTDRVLQVGFSITLESDHINHANSKIVNKPNYPEFGIEIRYIKKIIKDLFVVYARLINQYKFKYQLVFSGRFDQQDEDNQVIDQTEFFINININHNLPETDFDNFDNKSPLEHQIQQLEMQDSGWRFDKINSMTVFVFTKLVKLMADLMLKFI